MNKNTTEVTIAGLFCFTVILCFLIYTSDFKYEEGFKNGVEHALTQVQANKEIYCSKL